MAEKQYTNVSAQPVVYRNDGSAVAAGDTITSAFNDRVRALVDAGVLAERKQQQPKSETSGRSRRAAEKE